MYKTYSYTCPSKRSKGGSEASGEHSDDYVEDDAPEYCDNQPGITIEYKQFGGQGLAFFILAWLFQLVNVVFLCVVVPRADGGDGGGAYTDFDKQQPAAQPQPVVTDYSYSSSGAWGGGNTGTVAQY